MMKTPLTITASVWIYCQNKCTYCVSGSNSDDWKFNKPFEFYKPRGCENMNPYELEKRFGKNWYEKKHDGTLMNPEDVLSFDALAEWICVNHGDRLIEGTLSVHLSGGEPLLRPDIEEMAVFAVDFDLVICTNGKLIKRRTELVDADVKWLVAYHRESVSLEEFVEQIQPIKNKKHLVITVVHSADDLNAMPETKKSLADFNFEIRYNRNPSATDFSFRHRPEDVAHIASRVLQFVTPDGFVYPCNSQKFGHIGNVYSGQYEKEFAEFLDSHLTQCIKTNGCAAYQTAVKMSEL